MNPRRLSACGRAQAHLPRLLAGRAQDAQLVRHLGTCPRCRAGLRLARLAPRVDAAEPGTTSAAYVLAVVRAAGVERLAALLVELARACAATDPVLAARLPAGRRSRPVAEILEQVRALRRRLCLGTGAEPEGLPAWPASPPAPGNALQVARACLEAAESLAGPCDARRLQLAACSLAVQDEHTAGALCSELSATAGRPVERARLARRASRVAREWGLPPDRLAALLRQPARATSN